MLNNRISNGISVARILAMFWIVVINYFAYPGIFKSFFKVDYLDATKSVDAFLSVAYSNPFIPDKIFVFIGYAGWAGVVVFTIISGFSLWLSFLQSKRFFIPDYILKRFLSIYLPFLVSACIFFFFGLYYQGSDIIPNNILKLIFGVSDFVRFIYNINSPIWYMGLISILYLLFPIIPMLYKRFKLWFPLAMAVLFYLFDLFFPRISSMLYPFMPFWIYFCIGIILAHFVYQYHDYHFFKNLCYIAIPISLYGIIWFTFMQPQSNSDSWHILHYYWLGFIATVLFFSIGYLLPISWHKILRWLSRGTFAVFLYHYIVLPLIATKLNYLGYASVTFTVYYGALLSVLTILLIFFDNFVNKYIKPLFTILIKI